MRFYQKHPTNALKIAWLISLILIIFLAYGTFHIDHYHLSFFSSKIAHGNFDIYGNLNRDNYDNLRNPKVSIFPPLSQFADGSLYYLFERIGIYRFDFTTLLDNPVKVPKIFMLLKLRLLVPFLLSLWLLAKTAKLINKKETIDAVLTMWLLSPIALFSVFAQGNNDIYATMFAIAFLYLAFQKKIIFAFIALGIAAGIKNFPLLLVFPSALILSEKKIPRFLLYFLLPLVVYLLPLLAYRQYAFHFFTAGNREALFMLNNLFFNSIVFGPFLYFLLGLNLVFNQQITEQNKKHLLLKYLLLTLIIIFTTSFFHPQWFLWTVPFFILLSFRNRRLFYLYLLINFLYFILLYTHWSKNLDFYMFRYLIPTVTNNISFYDFLIQHIPTLRIPELFNTLFVATISYYGYLMNKVDQKDKPDLKQSEIILSISPLIGYLFFAWFLVATI